MCRCADNRGLAVTSRDSEFKKPYRGVATPSWSVSERSLLPAVATQPPGQFALRSMATHGDASTLTYNRVQLTTLDRVPWRTDISPALDGGSFEHFKTSVRLPPLMAPSDARRHSPTVVSAFKWCSTAFIHGFWTAAERQQKPPMCNSGKCQHMTVSATDNRTRFTFSGYAKFHQIFPKNDIDLLYFNKQLSKCIAHL